MARLKNRSWSLPVNADDTAPWDSIKVALLMDLRDELQVIRVALAPLQRLNCADFLAIPTKLDAIEQNTRKPKRKRARRRQA